MSKFWLLSLFLIFSVIGGYILMTKNKLHHLAKNDQFSGWTIIIPGITGDLAKRKLIPALFTLYRKGMKSIIIGTGRRDSQIQDILNASKEFIHNIDEALWLQFSAHVKYKRLDPSNEQDFKHLETFIKTLEAEYMLQGKRLVYLSIPADIYCTITKNFAQSNIIERNKMHYIMYEKPFGWDLKSAQEIQQCITSLLDNKQIYRVDHYVAKGLTHMVTDLATHSIFSPLWNSTYIERVAVSFHETLGIEGRGMFYDQYGAIKDVLQNHMLQLLSFFSINLQKKDTLTVQKVSFLNSLLIKSVERGQYEGYLKEKDVKPESKTETYAYITLISKDPRWKGIEFILETGKALAQKRTELRIKFKNVGTCNELIFEFASQEQVALIVYNKENTITLNTKPLHFTEAYQALFEDALSQTFSYSVSFEEIAAQWRLTDKIMENKTGVAFYPKGRKAILTSLCQEDSK